MRLASSIIVLLALASASAQAGSPAAPNSNAAMAQKQSITAEKLRELPIDNLTQVIAGKAGGTALEAVIAMIDAFTRRSYAEYAAWFAPDYVFVSSDPTVRAAHPQGMSREDELEFARVLFRDGLTPSLGIALPHALRIRMSHGKMRITGPVPSDTSTWVIIEALRAQIEMSDGSLFDTGEAHHELSLVATSADWRIRRWIESRRDEPAVAAGTVAVVSQAADSSAVVDSTAAAAKAQVITNPMLPTRLDLYPLTANSRNGLAFSIALPNPDGMLEMFDVQGRRVVHLDLAGLRPGNHRIALESGSIPSGVYWARLRQATASVTARVVWVR